MFQETVECDIQCHENSPCLCMTFKNFMITLDDGRMSTWRLPRRSALTMLFCLRSEQSWELGMDSDPQDSHSNTRISESLSQTRQTRQLLTKTEMRTIFGAIQSEHGSHPDTGIDWLYSYLSHISAIPGHPFPLTFLQFGLLTPYLRWYLHLSLLLRRIFIIHQGRVRTKTTKRASRVLIEK